jgi:hypothetical protein
MALFSFGRKDKKPPEVTGPVEKTPPTPPKIQTPPGTGSFPAVKAPQPTGLMPASMPAGTATTQPLSTSRTGMMGLKQSRPVPAASRSTQRIVLPTSASSKPSSTKPLGVGTPGGRINLPAGMILRCLPTEVLAADISEFEANGTAATEIGLPMNMILGQLPSGKVEMAFQDLIPHFPAGYLQPTESLAAYLSEIVSLPLMDVVMRIPPDLLALRPDQKDVDAAVINMADPFTEEILREQAETARRQSQTNIIDESQAPQEEFVPRDQAAAVKAPVAAPAPSRSSEAPPMPTVAKLPTPPMSGSRGPAAPVSPETSAPVPPVPRHTGTIPAPPPPRHTTSLPVTRRTVSLPPSQVPGQSTVDAAAPPPAATPDPAEKPVTTVAPGMPDAAADNLQRLAALAMRQLGDSSETPVETPPKPAPAPAPESKIVESKIADAPPALVAPPPRLRRRNRGSRTRRRRLPSPSI